MWVKNCIRHRLSLMGGDSYRNAPLIIIGSELQTNIHPSMKGGAIMQFLTHIIFLLNLLKTLIHHFS